MLGKIIYEHPYSISNKNDLKINMKAIQGIYFIRIGNSKSLYSSKIIIR